MKIESRVCDIDLRVHELLLVAFEPHETSCLELDLTDSKARGAAIVHMEGFDLVGRFNIT